jgi:putative PIN family toxin of toxin-antitoxin system
VRVVLDTNVLVSALLNVHGAPAQVLSLLRQGILTLCADGRILDEYEEVLGRPEFPFGLEDVATLVRFLRQSCELVSTRPPIHPLPDPDDEPFLEVAAYGRVDALVTGNIRHYPDDRRVGVRVVAPAELIASIRARGPHGPAE